MYILPCFSLVNKIKTAQTLWIHVSDVLRILCRVVLVREASSVRRERRGHHTTQTQALGWKESKGHLDPEDPQGKQENRAEMVDLAFLESKDPRWERRPAVLVLITRVSYKGVHKFLNKSILKRHLKQRSQFFLASAPFLSLISLRFTYQNFSQPSRVTAVLARLARRVSQGSQESKVGPEVLVSLALALLVHLDFVENPENLVSMDFQGNQVYLDRRVSVEEEECCILGVFRARERETVTVWISCHMFPTEQTSNHKFISSLFFLCVH